MIVQLWQQTTAPAHERTPYTHQAMKPLGSLGSMTACALRNAAVNYLLVNDYEIASLYRLPMSDFHLSERELATGT